MVGDQYQMDMDSFLSPKVKHLVCEVGAMKIDPAEEEESQRLCLNKDGSLQLDYMESVVFEGINISDVNDFEDLVKRLAPVCQAVDSYVLMLSVEELRYRYQDRLKWTGMEQVFLQSLELREVNCVGNTICLLLMTSALERALGDLYLLKNSPCPSMLKDLLGTEELRSVLGDVVITCLRILIGPPTSLNLRNIVWHGFAAPQDIPIRYSGFLFILTASIGSIIDAHIAGANIPHRFPLNLPQMEQIQHQLHDFLIPDLSQTDHLFSQSNFIAMVMLPYWQSALDFYKRERYGICVMLLLTQLEQSLRQVFAAVNNCPHRVLTAESCILFTTFDEMLCQSLPDGSQNALVQAVGVSFMEMLLDLLEHQEGPRLRDHISHGELDIMNMSKDVADYVLLVSNMFCVCTQKVENETYGNENLIIPENLQTLSTSYTSIFHPLSKLKSELLDCINAMTSWSSLKHPSYDELMHTTWCNLNEEDFVVSNVYLAAKNMFPDAGDEDIEGVLGCLNPFANNQPLQSFCEQLNPLTLFRPRSEFEVITILRHIVEETTHVITNVTKITAERYQQWVEKKLRSRQRNNYVRLLNRSTTFHNVNILL